MGVLSRASESVEFARRLDKNKGPSTSLKRLCDEIKANYKSIDKCDGMETSTGPHITVPLKWVTNGKLNSVGHTYLRQEKITWWVSILYSDDDMNCFEKYPYHLVSSSTVSS